MRQSQSWSRYGLNALGCSAGMRLTRVESTDVVCDAVTTSSGDSTARHLRLSCPSDDEMRVMREATPQISPPSVSGRHCENHWRAQDSDIDDSGDRAAEVWGSSPGHFAVLECRFINRKLQTGVCHQPNCSSTPAALVEAILRPMYTFCVSEGWACPSWSAMARADNPASSSRVAAVLRKT